MTINDAELDRMLQQYNEELCRQLDELIPPEEIERRLAEVLRHAGYDSPQGESSD